MVSGCGAALLVLAGLSLAADRGRAAPVPAQMQRMLISAGCYRIAGHATGAVAAYCLDEAGTAPGRGAILGETPALGEATVSVGDKSMPLKAALARHLLRIEGTDTPDQVSLVNTTDQTLSFCVGRPVVIMGNGVAYSADLQRIYDQIVDLMRLDAPSAPTPAEEPGPHARLQQRLWSLVNAADERELATPWPPTGASAIDREDCAVSEHATVLCH
jgi:hypothetical protein